MANQWKLSSRLRLVAGQVRPGAVAADVGTDHGYLACALAGEGICPRVYASDLNPGPLRQAEKTIELCGLGGQVTALLSDGVANLPLEEIDDVIVAGMGGDLILSIVEDPRLKAAGKRLILQPMTKPEVLRRGLYRMGFALESEQAVEDGRFVYTVMTAVYTGVCREIDPLTAYAGLVSGADGEEAKAYLSRILSGVTKKRNGLEQGDGDPETIRALCLLENELKERIGDGEDR